ncbi:MAG: EF-P lysine aminoacylase GenX [Magnetococcales bacterium]|nr:EF-P lysine aminoacylase GenX [Magnetococcales bacterium]
MPAPARAAVSWRPTATVERLRLRAELLARTRAFFAERGVMEVETPMLLPTVPVEKHIHPIPALPEGTHERPRFLHASPEAAMKRLLAAGCGAIYQFARVFRAGEWGRLHNPEFTMLEWYRPGWDDQLLMRETAQLADQLLDCGPATMLSYRELFLEHAGFDPLLIESGQLKKLAAALPAPPAGNPGRDGLLDLFLVQKVEPALQTRGGALIVHGYPPSQAAMARIDPGPPPTARRFELYVHGVELANGYWELTNPVEQEERLNQANRQRVKEGLAPMPMDDKFLTALEAGLPSCAGVALGFDRLVMLAAGAASLSEVMAFDWERA